MQQASDEIINLKTNPNGEIIDTEVSVNGAWQRREYSSLNGAVAAVSIDMGHILDVHPMSRYCQACVNNCEYIKGIYMVAKPPCSI